MRWRFTNRYLPSIVFILLSSAYGFSQIETPVYAAKSYIDQLQSSHKFTFSYPATVDTLKAKSMIAFETSDQSQIIKTFESLGCEAKIIGNHILLRPILDENLPSAYEIKIVDEKSKEPISWAAITTIEKGIEKVYFTTDEGKARIPKTAKNAKVSQLGYTSQDLLLNTDRTVGLKVNPVAIKEIKKVSDQKSVVTSNPLNLKHNYTTPYALSVLGPGGIKDVLASVQMLPGIVAAEDKAGSIKIRGSNADETTIYLDQVPVLQSGHFFEIFSSINPLFVDQYTVYKNATPIEDPSNTGGSVHLSSRDAKRKYLSAKADINLLTASTSIYVPIAEKFSISGAYRSTYKAIARDQFYNFDKTFIPTPDYYGLQDNPSENIIYTSPQVSFSDHNFRAQYADKKLKASISTFGISDDFLNSFTQPQEVKIGNKKEIIDTKLENNRAWTSSGLGANLSYQIHKNHQLSANLFRSTLYDDYGLTSRVSDKPNFTKLGTETLFRTEVAQKGIQIYDQAQITDKLAAKLGVQATSYDNATKFNTSRNQAIPFESEGLARAIFGEVSWADTRLKQDFGLKYQGINSGFLDARYFGVIHLHQAIDLKYGMAIAHQIQRRIDIRDIADQSLGVWMISGQNGIPVLRSKSLMAGTLFRKSNFLLDIEAYYKTLDGVAEYVNLQPGFREQKQTLKLFSGEGNAYGVDLLAQYDLRNYQTQFAYSYGRILYTMPDIFRGETYAAPNDRPHQIKWSNTVKVKDFAIHGNMIYATGQPYLIGGVDPNRNINTLNKVDFINRLPDYFRTDVGANYTLKIKNIQSTLTFDIFNVTNHKNVKLIQYINSVKDNRDKTAATVVGTRLNLINRMYNVGVNLSI